jgi:hypothetical protein
MRYFNARILIAIQENRCGFDGSDDPAVIFTPTFDSRRAVAAMRVYVFEWVLDEQKKCPCKDCTGLR